MWSYVLAYFAPSKQNNGSKIINKQPEKKNQITTKVTNKTNQIKREHEKKKLFPLIQTYSASTLQIFSLMSYKTSMYACM